jgi:hypothetical protein
MGLYAALHFMKLATNQSIYKYITSLFLTGSRFLAKMASKSP